MRLYSYWRSSSAWRVRIALNHKRVAYAYVAVNIGPQVSEHHGAEFAAINPLREVPTLEWEQDGQTQRLTQSVAIIEYLEELVPAQPLLPTGTHARALVREAVQIVNAGTQPLQNTWVQSEIGKLASEAAVRAFVQKVIARGLAALEAHAQQNAGRYLVGDEPSMADLYLVPQLYNARRVELDLGAFPNLLRVDAALAPLPAFAEAHPTRQPDAQDNP
jgi:maleylpyruvate isomerase